MTSSHEPLGQAASPRLLTVKGPASSGGEVTITVVSDTSLQKSNQTLAFQFGRHWIGIESCLDRD